MAIKSTKVGDVELGGLPEGAAFTPDGKYLFVGNYLVLVDTRRNRPHPDQVGRERSHQIAGTGLVAKKVSSHWEVRSMQYPQVFVRFALVPLATSAVAECLKSNVEGQSAQGLQSVVRAMLLDGRRLRTFFDFASNACLDANNRDQAVRRARTIHIFPADE